jgi:hypothetical protein
MATVPTSPLIQGNSAPGLGPNAAALLAWAANNTSVYSVGTPSVPSDLANVLTALLAQMSLDYPVPNLNAPTIQGARCHTYLAAIIEAL